MELQKNSVAHLLAIIIVISYFLIQWYVIYHPGNKDDVVSTHVSDLVVIVAWHYFSSKKNGDN